MYTNTHIHTKAELQRRLTVLGSEYQCEREAGLRKLSVFMLLCSGFTAEPTVQEYRNISLHLPVLELF
jgi:hypothetical protein